MDDLRSEVVPAFFRRAFPGVTVVGLLAAHSCLLAWSAWRHSPTYDEMFHLPAGVSHLELGRFDSWRRNPPLVRTIAALPTVLASPHAVWRDGDDDLERSCYVSGLDFFCVNGSRSLWFVTMGRWACIPFSLLGGYVCFRWARTLYGIWPGLLAIALWCFSPYVLGHASLMTPHAHAAAMGVAACYGFWLWLRRPSWQQSLIAGVALGASLLIEFTLVVLYPLWLVMWGVYRLRGPHAATPRRWFREGRMVLATTASSIVVINLGYGFEGSFQRFRDYRFHSRLFTGTDSLDEAPEDSENRFAHTWLGGMPVPIPGNYLRGIDKQWLEFEQRKWSYMRGEWHMGSQWYFCPYALAVKVPLGSWVLALLAGVLTVFRKEYSAPWRDEVVLLLPLAAILVLVASQDGIGHDSAHVLPILPFAFIWQSKIARAARLKHPLVVLLTGGALLWSVGSSLCVYPHSLSYFNELVGGPTRGYAHLAVSNVSWGQDLLYLRRWLHEHPEARPLHLASSGPLDPRLLGIQFVLPPFGPTSSAAGDSVPDDQLGPQPGWYAIDVNFLCGTGPLSAADGTGSWNEPWGGLCYFRQFSPVAMAGYSIYIYHITLEEANRVRRELNLPELPPDWRPPREGSTDG